MGVKLQFIRSHLRERSRKKGGEEGKRGRGGGQNRSYCRDVVSSSRQRVTRHLPISTYTTTRTKLSSSSFSSSSFRLRRTSPLLRWGSWGSSPSPFASCNGFAVSMVFGVNGFAVMSPPFVRSDGSIATRTILSTLLATNERGRMMEWEKERKK